MPFWKFVIHLIFYCVSILCILKLGMCSERVALHPTITELQAMVAKLEGDYKQAKANRDAAWEKNRALGVFALELVKARGWKVDEVWVCRPEASDSDPYPRPAYITTEWSQECKNSTRFHFIYDAAGEPSFAPYGE